ncbi:glycosyltransferase [Coleofasciculus chthonoplastes]|uniref:glycosyltransferase n=1 Tax=Coleofasciculus chthonoplastes TaxID=64178 RepID=UPI0032F78104
MNSSFGFKKPIPSDIDDHLEANDYPSFNALIFYLASRNLYRPIILSQREIFCGPDCETKTKGEKFRSIKTPTGQFDIAPIIDQLPRSQKPDIVVVKADATRRNFPSNLQSLDCPKLLIVGDTHHFSAPIRTLIEYASQEDFDFIMSEHDRHHLHYFKEAGFDNVFWVPGFNVNPHPQLQNLNPKYPLSFVGQTGRFHPYRKYILHQVKQFGFSLNQQQASPEKAAEIYANSLINLNISLNGDLNLRVFEILSSGGFLLTDKLSQQAGLELLFDSGKHLATFKNESELKYKIAFFLDNPEAAREIARKGHEAFWRNHRPEINVQRVLDYINGRNIDPIYQVKTDKRSIYVTTDNLKELRDRLSVYEYLQELHLKQPSLRGLFGQQVDHRIICDAVDLPRLALHLIWDSREKALNSSQLFAQCEITDQITFTSWSQRAKNRNLWQFIALTWTELQTLGIDTLLNQLNFQRLIITDAAENLGEDDQQILDDYLEQCGFEKDSHCPLIYHWERKADWGSLLLSQQRLLEAVRAFEQALQENPWDFVALLELGMLSFKLNHLQEAERLLHQAVSWQRRNSLALEQLANVLIALNRHEEAIGILEHLVVIAPQSASFWSLLEKCYRQMGLDQKALEAYRHCRHLRSSKIGGETGTGRRVKSTAKTALKRILVINNLYPPQELGGYGRYISDFANILRERGHTVEVLSSNAPYLGEIKTSEVYADRSLTLYGSYEQLPPKVLEDPSEFRQVVDRNDQIIRQKIESYAPEVCLVGNIDFLSQRVFEPLFENKIPTIHHVAFNQPGYPISDTPESSFYHLSACSEFVKQNILQQGYPLNDISVIYPGAFVEKFKMPLLPSFDKLRIVFASLVLPYKGPQTVVEALAILHDADIDFHCVIAGAAPDQSFLKQLKDFTKVRGIEDKVDFFGYLPRTQLVELYATHNVFVFPSVWQEPFGISQVEGMAASLTVITSGTGGAGEIVESGVSGLTFPPGNAVALAEAWVTLIRDRQRWEGITVAGQERAVSLFDIERSVDLLEDKFDELLIQHTDKASWKKKLQSELQETLQLRDTNFIIFPDWSASEESCILELERVLRVIATYPKRSQMTLLIYIKGISEEDANLLLSGIAMNLLLQEDLDVTEEAAISLIDQLNDIQWETLFSCIQARIVLENENKAVITAVRANQIPICKLDDLDLSHT